MNFLRTTLSFVLLAIAAALGMGVMLGPASALRLQPPVELG